MIDANTTKATITDGLTLIEKRHSESQLLEKHEYDHT